MALDRVCARWIGFIVVVIAGVWFELSPWGARVTAAVLDLQLLALSHWGPQLPAPATAATTPDPGAEPVSHSPALQPLSRTVATSLVVIGALVWWESRLLGWAIASSLTALVALLAVSTMMAPRGVLVPTAGPGLAIVAGLLGRRGVEAVIAFRDRGRSPTGRRPKEDRPAGGADPL